MISLFSIFHIIYGSVPLCATKFFEHYALDTVKEVVHEHCECRSCHGNRLDQVVAVRDKISTMAEMECNISIIHILIYTCWSTNIIFFSYIQRVWQVFPLRSCNSCILNVLTLHNTRIIRICCQISKTVLLIQVLR